MPETAAAAPSEPAAPVPAPPAPQQTPEPQTAPPAAPEPTQAPAEAKPEAPAQPKRELKSDAHKEAARQAFAIRQKEAALKKQAAEIEARAAALKEAEEIVNLARSRPLDLLKRAGVTNDALSQYILSDGKPDPLVEAQRVRQEFEQYKQQQAAQLAAAQQAQHERVIQQFRTDTVEWLNEHADKWELINAYGAHKRVSDLVEQRFAEEGVMLSTDAAADEIEAELEAQIEKLSATKKWQSKWAPKAAPAPAAPPKTIAGLAPAAGSEPARKLTDEERVENAIKKLRELQTKKE